MFWLLVTHCLVSDQQGSCCDTQTDTGLGCPSSNPSRSPPTSSGPLPTFWSCQCWPNPHCSSSYQDLSAGLHWSGCPSSSPSRTTAASPAPQMSVLHDQPNSHRLPLFLAYQPWLIGRLLLARGDVHVLGFHATCGGWWNCNLIFLANTQRGRFFVGCFAASRYADYCLLCFGRDIMLFMRITFFA